jgi:hypothetical protein
MPNRRNRQDRHEPTAPLRSAAGRFLFAIALTTASGLAAPTEAAVTGWTSVPVRVYEMTTVQPAELARALDVAERTLSRASVEIAWKSCAAREGSPDGPTAEAASAAACLVPRTSGELSVRIVRSAAVTPSQRVLPLGDALVDAATGGGVLATVYLDRVEWLARAAGADRATLLGRAIAHELGHLLLGSTGHSTAGLMRALWSRDEIRRDHTNDWTFTTRDVAALQARRRGY